MKKRNRSLGKGVVRASSAIEEPEVVVVSGSAAEDGWEHQGSYNGGKVHVWHKQFATRFGPVHRVRVDDGEPEASPTGYSTKEEAMARAHKYIQDAGYTKDAAKASSSEEDQTIHCRSSGVALPGSAKWELDVPVQFQWLPGGTTTIVAHYGSSPIELTVHCDQQAAGVVQASYEQWLGRSRQEPFGCVEHREEEAAIRLPKGVGRFVWKDEPEPGIFCTAVPTDLGAKNVNGRVHRAWSPSFTTDADYASMEKQGNCLVFPEGVRGSASNPARVTGVAFSVGSLTNKPAFKNILPVRAKQAANASSSEEAETINAVASHCHHRDHAEHWHARAEKLAGEGEAKAAAEAAHAASYHADEAEFRGLGDLGNRGVVAMAHNHAAAANRFASSAADAKGDDTNAKSYSDMAKRHEKKAASLLRRVTASEPSLDEAIMAAAGASGNPHPEDTQERHDWEKNHLDDIHRTGDKAKLKQALIDNGHRVSHFSNHEATDYWKAVRDNPFRSKADKRRSQIGRILDIKHEQRTGMMRASEPSLDEAIRAATLMKNTGIIMAARAKVRSFTRSDWYGLSGAERPKEGEPLTGERSHSNGHNWTAVADKHGVQIMHHDKDGEYLGHHHMDVPFATGKHIVEHALNAPSHEHLKEMGFTWHGNGHDEPPSIKSTSASSLDEAIRAAVAEDVLGEQPVMAAGASEEAGKGWKQRVSGAHDASNTANESSNKLATMTGGQKLNQHFAAGNDHLQARGQHRKLAEDASENGLHAQASYHRSIADYHNTKWQQHMQDADRLGATNASSAEETTDAIKARTWDDAY